MNDFKQSTKERDNLFGVMRNIEWMLLLSSKTVYNKQEVMMLCGCSERTLERWCKERMFPYTITNGKAYFRKADIEAWLLSGRRVASKEEIQSRAAVYIINHKK